MGQQFSVGTQQSPITHEQLRWVPRSADMFGGGAQGGTLVMPIFGEDVLFSALAIRDTIAHQSLPPVAGANPSGVNFDAAYAVYKTALFTSTLNESVSLQAMWSRDQISWYPFGTAQTIAASTGAEVPAVLSLSVPTQYLPFVAVQATCATAPTSGVLNGWLERLG